MQLSTSLSAFTLSAAMAFGAAAMAVVNLDHKISVAGTLLNMPKS
jgi:hypothetical protein